MLRKIISLIIILAAIAIIANVLLSKSEVKKTDFNSPTNVIESSMSEADEEPVSLVIDEPKSKIVAEIIAEEKDEIIAAISEEGEKIVEDVVAEVKEEVEVAVEKVVEEVAGIASTKPFEPVKSIAKAVAVPGVVAAAIAATTKPVETEEAADETAAEIVEAPAIVAAIAKPVEAEKGILETVIRREIITPPVVAAIAKPVEAEEVTEKIADETAVKVEEKEVAIAEAAKGEVEEELSMAPDFTLPTYDGKSLTLSNLKGKRGVVLIFFATWCPSCMAEVDHVKAFVEAARDKNVLVFGISNQSSDIIEKFKKARGINYRLLHDEDSKVSREYGVVYIPLTVGIDAAGVVRYYDNRFPENTELFIKVLTDPLKTDK